MFIPYGTDAPLYYRPLATLSIIIINFAVFCLTGMGAEIKAYHWLILEFDCINPIQWVTSAFMHGSWSHLICNMIFLWCFGIVVEGKLGWQKFSLLYLGLAMADSAIGQIPMFILYGGRGGVLGASGVIFALMAISLLWAPDNDMHCLFTWTIYIVREIDVRIVHLAMFYFAKEALMVFLMTTFHGFHISTPLLHLMGMAVGFPFGIYMLKRGYVDCEGWDVFSRYGKGGFWSITGRMITRGRDSSAAVAMQSSYNQSAHDAYQQIMEDPKAFNADASPGTSPQQIPAFTAPAVPVPLPCDFDDAPASRVSDLSEAIRNEQPEQAVLLFNQIRNQSETNAIPDETLAQYAELLRRTGRHGASLQPLQILVSRKSKVANRARLQIALIQLQLHADPDAALATVNSLVRPWSERVEQRRSEILRAIRKATASSAQS